MDRAEGNLRLAIWPTVVSLILHAGLGYVGLMVIPPVAPTASASLSWQGDPGPMAWLETVPALAAEPVPTPDPVIEPEAPKDEPPKPAPPRELRIGQDDGSPESEALVGSDQPGEHAARLSTVEQPALRNTPSEPVPPATTGRDSGGGEGGDAGADGPKAVPVAAPAALPAPPARPPARPIDAPANATARPTEPAAPPMPVPVDPPPGSGEEGDQVEPSATERPRVTREADTPPITPGESPGERTGEAPEPPTRPTEAPAAAPEVERLDEVIADLLDAPPVPWSPRSSPDLSNLLVPVTAPALLLAPSVPPGTAGRPGPIGAATPSDSAQAMTGDPRLDDLAWLSEKVVDPTSLRRSAEYRHGRVASAEGLELVVTRRPESTTFTRLRGAARNPTYDIIFTRSGVVRDVVLVRGSGNGALDEDIANAIHFWKARGKDLSLLDDRPEATLTVRLTVLLLGS